MQRDANARSGLLTHTLPPNFTPEKKFWVELLIFFKRGEVITAWTLRSASCEYKRSPKQRMRSEFCRGSVYLDEPAPQSDLVCMSGSF